MKPRHDSLGGPPDHPEDLCALSRRGALTDAQRQRLDFCLSGSPALRDLLDAGGDFDRMETDLPGDDARVQRLALAAGNQVARPSAASALARARRGVSWLVGLALVSASVWAAAAFWRTTSAPNTYRAHPAVSAAPPSSLSSDDPPPAHARRDNSDSDAPEPSSRAPALPPADRNAASHDPKQTKSHPRTAMEHDSAGLETTSESPSTQATAAELFSAANQARRRGDIKEAVVLYDRLQTEYPQSGEALLSYALTGRVRLGRGEYEAALVAFSRYLSATPSGALAQEALYGKAEALRRMGRLAEERDVWRELLQRFPGSTYAETARERLRGGP